MNKRFLFFSRRIYARAWRIPLSPPALVTAILGGLFITFYGGSLLAARMDGLWAMNLASFAASGFILLGAAALAPRGHLAGKTGFRKIRKEDLFLIAAGILIIMPVAALLTASWQQILELLNVPYTKEQGLIQLVKGAGRKELFQLFLLTAVAVPLTEELMFRRCLYNLLIPLGGAAALIGTSLIFSAAHGFLLGVPGLFFIGVIFQCLANMTRNLWSSVICHACHNAVVLLVACMTL